MSTALIAIAYWAIGIAWYRLLTAQISHEPSWLRWLVIPLLWLPFNTAAACILIYHEILKGAGS